MVRKKPETCQLCLRGKGPSNTFFINLFLFFSNFTNTIQGLPICIITYLCYTGKKVIGFVLKTGWDSSFFRHKKKMD